MSNATAYRTIKAADLKPGDVLVIMADKHLIVSGVWHVSHNNILVTTIDGATRSYTPRKPLFIA